MWPKNQAKKIFFLFLTAFSGFCKINQFNTIFPSMSEETRSVSGEAGAISKLWYFVLAAKIKYYFRSINLTKIIFIMIKSLEIITFSIKMLFALLTHLSRYAR